MSAEAPLLHSGDCLGSSLESPKTCTPPSGRRGRGREGGREGEGRGGRGREGGRKGGRERREREGGREEGGKEER